MDKREYIISLIKKEDEPLRTMREIASNTETYAPIVPSDTAQLLKTLLHIIKPKRILEIGTAIGYSAILMAKNTSEDCEIITVERYEKVADIAINNIFEAGFEKKIRVVKGEAVDIINWLDGDFDMVFMDGAKGQYIEFLPRVLELLKTGGVLITDDVLYHEPNVEENATTRHRKYTIVQRLRQYLEVICNHPELETTVIEAGEGIAVSYKKG
ncbi:MAG: O-methyltransferase [Clostridia bacterium]|nr:O-methyltransferase [Clostridia bacterium]